MSNKKVLAIIAAILGVFLLALLSWRYMGNPSVTLAPTSTNNNTPTSTPPAATSTPATPASSTVGTTGLVVTAPAPNASVSSPLQVTGYITGQDRWTAFEAQAGTVQLLDGNGAQLAISPLTAVGEWMQPRVNFQTSLTFSMPITPTGTLVFRNENASGMPAYAREFRMPVNFSSAQAATMPVKVYFSNSKLDPEFNCEKVFPVTRTVRQTDGVARAALQELFKIPSAIEKAAGYTTNLNTGVQINSLTIENGVAKADFNEQLQKGVGGSCRVTAIRAQIEATLKQFPTIKSVVISINGNSEDILQP